MLRKSALFVLLASAVAVINTAQAQTSAADAGEGEAAVWSTVSGDPVGGAADIQAGDGTVYDAVEPSPASGGGSAVSDAVEPSPAAAETAAGDNDAGGAPATETPKGAKQAKAGDDPPESLLSRFKYDYALGMVTIDNETWTHILLGIGFPVWRLDVFLDLELFLDSEHNLSNKSWDFENNTADAIFRKIRYISYGKLNDPLFIRFGTLKDVTLGRGFIMDRFTNTKNYPADKLLGLQVNVNDYSALGISLQSVISDFDELLDDGGIAASRLAFRPLKKTGLPIIRGLTLGGTYAVDINTHAPARKWTVSGENAILRDMRDKYDGTQYFEDLKDSYEKNTGLNADSLLNRLDAEKVISETTNSFSLYGFDVVQPIINTNLLGLSLYGHYASRTDNVKGWGIGAPGVSFNLWKLNGSVEYRQINGRFTPNFFDEYYLNERYLREELMDKGEFLTDNTYNGVFGRAGMDVFGLLNLTGSYQYMTRSGNRIEAYEGVVGLGKLMTDRIPPLKLAEAYVRNRDIGNHNNIKYDKNGVAEPGKLAGRFDPSPFLHCGVRANIEIYKGFALVWEYGYGWEVENARLVSSNEIKLRLAKVGI